MDPPPSPPPAVAQAGSTVYSTCVATSVTTKTKTNRKRVQRYKSVKYHLVVLNKVKSLCLESLCVRVDLPDEVMYSKSRLIPPNLLRNATTARSWGGAWRSRKSDVEAAAGRLVRENGTTSVLWSDISLAPGKWGRFSVKMKALSGPGGQPGTLAIRGSVYQCMDANSCKNNVPPTPVRIMAGDECSRPH